MRVNLKAAFLQVFDKNHLTIASYNCIRQLHHKITSRNSILKRNELDRICIVYLIKIISAVPIYNSS